MKKTIGKAESENEKLNREAQEIVKKEGAKGWNLAKVTLLQQETHNPQLKEALIYATELSDYFRPAIVSLCCKAVSGNLEITVPCGASFVMLSKAIGIHDDIIDNLKARNKRRTLFGKFGKEIALIISDILVFKAFTLMRKNAEIGIPQETTGRIFETINTFWSEQAESEILEFQSRGKTEITPQQSLAKIRMRASELEAITRIGGILGNGSESEIEALGMYGRLLGTASILRDELIDMLELEALRNRLKYESLPLPLIYAIQNDKLKFKKALIISKKEIPRRTLLEISKAADDLRGMDFVATNIEKMVYKAVSCVERFQRENNELKLLPKSLMIRPQEWRSVLESTI